MRINLILVSAATAFLPAPSTTGPGAQAALPSGVSELPAAPGGCAGQVVVERTAFLMGTLLRLEVLGSDRACGLAASEAALKEVARLEWVLSSWRPDSEVGRLNTSVPGERWPLSDELLGLLAEARHFVALTGGAFDPGAGALLDAWDLQGEGRVPSDRMLVDALSTSGLDQLRLDVTGRMATRPAAAWRLDTGAFGKGAALRAATGVLRAHGVHSAVLDFGGQLLVLGAVREVAIAHPGARRQALPLRLRVGGASVATTSAGERFVAVAGTRHGHVLDPRTGRPVPAWGSVTVVAEDALAADALSTGLFVLGPEGALAWAAAHPEYGVVVQELVGDDVVISGSAVDFFQPGDGTESTDR